MSSKADISQFADRTGELRKLGYQGRRLGAEQMTTDTAARVTRLIVSGKRESRERPTNRFNLRKNRLTVNL